MLIYVVRMGYLHDQIDMVVTKSQFKFWNLYLDDAGQFDCPKWKSAFEEEVHGYKRTFNVAKYADAPEDLGIRAC